MKALFYFTTVRSGSIHLGKISIVSLTRIHATELPLRCEIRFERFADAKTEAMETPTAACLMPLQTRANPSTNRRQPFVPVNRCFLSGGW